MSARKYRQRGYLDDEPGKGGAPRGRRPERQGPRGRGFGAPTETLFKCSRCGARADARELDFGAACDSCGEDLHSCSNCRFFDTSAPNECRTEVEERVAAKTEKNDCALFEPKLVQGFASDGGSDDDPRAAFDSLFDF